METSWKKDEKPSHKKGIRVKRCGKGWERCGEGWENDGRMGGKKVGKG